MPHTIHGELRLPPAFVQGRLVDELEDDLEAYDLLPEDAQQRRWRMDVEHPGGYVLTYAVTLPSEQVPWP